MFKLAYSSTEPQFRDDDIVQGTLSTSVPERTGIVASIGSAISNFGPISTALGWSRHVNYESLYTFLCRRSDIEAIREDLNKLERYLSHPQKFPRLRKGRHVQKLSLKLCMQDRRGLLASFTQELTDLKINIGRFKAATTVCPSGHNLFFLKLQLECPVRQVRALQNKLISANQEEGWDVELFES